MFIDGIISLLLLFAAPYRVLTCKSGLLGCSRAMAWFSVLIAYPIATVAYVSRRFGLFGFDAGPLLLSFGVLVALCLVHTVASCFRKQPMGKGHHSWLGQLEWVIIPLLVFLMWTSDTGTREDRPYQPIGVFIGLGFACNLLALYLDANRDSIRAHRRRGRAPTFAGRVGSFLVGHAIWSVVIGGVGIGTLFSVGLKILSVPAAIILTAQGHKVTANDESQEEVKGLFGRAKEALGEVTGAVRDKLDDVRADGSSRCSECDCPDYVPSSKFEECGSCGHSELRHPRTEAERQEQIARRQQELLLHDTPSHGECELCDCPQLRHRSSAPESWNCDGCKHHPGHHAWKGPGPRPKSEEDYRTGAAILAIHDIPRKMEEEQSKEQEAAMARIRAEQQAREPKTKAGQEIQRRKRQAMWSLFK